MTQPLYLTVENFVRFVGGGNHINALILVFISILIITAR